MKEYVEISQDHEPLKIAVKGYLPRIIRLWQRWGIKQSRQLWSKYSSPYCQEAGIAPLNKVKLLIMALNKIAPECSEFLKDYLFSDLNDQEKRYISFEKWFEIYTSLNGEITNLAVANRRKEMRIKRFELIEHLKAGWSDTD